MRRACVVFALGTIGLSLLGAPALGRVFPPGYPPDFVCGLSQQAAQEKLGLTPDSTVSRQGGCVAHYGLTKVTLAVDAVSGTQSSAIKKFKRQHDGVHGFKLIHRIGDIAAERVTPSGGSDVIEAIAGPWKFRLGITNHAHVAKAISRALVGELAHLDDPVTR